jgi:hypothetical protein
MNKAFIREPDEPEHLKCPECGAIGETVGSVTLTEHVDERAAGQLGSFVAWCPNPQCPVGYFDALGQRIAVAEVRGVNWPKDPRGPVCPCRNITADEIEADARAGRRERVKELLAYANSPDSPCVRCAANGRNCVAVVQQLFLAAMKR